MLALLFIPRRNTFIIIIQKGVRQYHFRIETTTVVIEVNMDKGDVYHLVCLPDNVIKENNFRIAACLQKNGYKVPGKKITMDYYLIQLPIFHYCGTFRAYESCFK